MKFTVVAILACAIASSAFSLEKATSRTVARFPQALQRGSFKLSSSPADIGEGGEGEIVAAAAKAPAAPTSTIDKIWTPNTQLAAYMAVWYLGNIYYNIYNKKACIALGKNSHGHSNAHWALSAVQLLVGVLFVVPCWSVEVFEFATRLNFNLNHISTNELATHRAISLITSFHFPDKSVSLSVADTKDSGLLRF
jgi:hypothetical protein